MIQNNLVSRGRRELILLMMALTKAGKTTIAMALCRKALRNSMAKLFNFRTEVTVDWTYDPDAISIMLKYILLKNKAIFGTEIKERYRCEKFNEILDSKEGSFLKEFFGLEKQTGLSAEELQQYVESKIADYISTSDGEKLSKLIKHRLANRFIRRIKITVPPEENFKNYLKKTDITFVLRDTRGLLDMDVEEVKNISGWTMQDLGIDGINAVLLLGTSAPFPDVLDWYKKAYKSALESVPVYIMSRQDAITILYDFKYGTEKENINDKNVRKFLQIAKEGTEKGFRDFSNAFIQCYRLLEMFEIGKFTDNEFKYSYQVYNNEDLCYVYPNSQTLLHSVNSEPDYDAPDYMLYEAIIFLNLTDMISKMIEHETFREAVSKKGQIYEDFLADARKTIKVNMRPKYQSYSRSDVNENILEGENILGPRNGITTTEHGEILYLGAITSAISTREWLRSKVNTYDFSGTLKNENGIDAIRSIPKAYQKNLIRMFVLKIIEDNTDPAAYFREYYFIDRDKIAEAIINVRAKAQNADALTETALEILNIIF